MTHFKPGRWRGPSATRIRAEALAKRETQTGAPFMDKRRPLGFTWGELLVGVGLAVGAGYLGGRAIRNWRKPTTTVAHGDYLLGLDVLSR